MTTNLTLSVGGREIANATDHVSRYCGLPWSGGSPEVWAYQYYDDVPVDHDNVVTPVDVLSAAALHPGLSRADLAYFIERRDAVTEWLEALPSDLVLWNVDDSRLAHLDSLTELADGVSLTLLTKVLHRKRPGCIPLLDRHVIDWYRPVTGERRPYEAWAPLVRAIRSDIETPEDRLVALVQIPPVRPAGGHLSLIRFIDIAIWMSAR